MHTITAAARIDIVIPRPTNLVTFLDNDKIPTTGTRDQINSCTHAF